MSKKRLWNLIAGVALCIVLAVLGATGLALYGRWQAQLEMKDAVTQVDAGRIKQLIDQGADPATIGEAHLNALFAAADTGDERLARRVIQAGINPDCMTSYRQSPLMHAASHGQVGMIQLLITGGARVNLRDSAGQTALMFAAGSGHVNAVQVLLAAGADPALKDRQGNTALSQARRYNRRFHPGAEAARLLEGAAAGPGHPASSR